MRRRRAPALERSAGTQLSVPVGEIEELRRKLVFLERLVAAFDELREVQGTAEIIARLAVAELASACWIYLRDARHGLRLAYAAQSDPAKDPADLPDDLGARVSNLGRPSKRRFSTSPGDGSRVLPLEAEGVLLGAIALIPEGAPTSSTDWGIELLADQAAKALSRARSYQAAKHAVGVRDEAFAAAGHELGNSLGALRLQIHALLRTELARKTATPLLQRLHSMEWQVANLIGLNQRMLAPSRLTAYGFEPKLERVDLSEIIREVLAREADQLAWRRCPVEFARSGPVVGLWDRGLLDQIFSNLLSNAMKYGHGKPISVTLKTTKASAFLGVRDEGIGIAAEDQGRIFEKFERAATIETGASLGLGLWIAREMVLALGGAIRVQSAIGAGSTFVVELPRRARALRRERKTT